MYSINDLDTSFLVWISDFFPENRQALSGKCNGAVNGDGNMWVSFSVILRVGFVNERARAEVGQHAGEMC